MVGEYSNKLVRQYIPKQSEFNNFDDEFIKQVQYKMNRRPRRNLNFKIPKTSFIIVLHLLVESTMIKYEKTNNFKYFSFCTL